MGKILIIGANGAVGKSCIQKLKDNNELVLISRSKEEDSENSPNITSITLDINDYENTQKFINSIDYEISGIIFALGSIVLKPFKQTSVKEFIEVMNSNFFNVANFLHNSIDKFSDNSSVVFFSSIAASRGFKNHTAISSAKSALKGLSVSLAADFAPKIRFNTISPSLSYSKMSNFITSNEKVAEGLGKLHPMSRLGNGSDIAELAVFLISNQSSWITGQNFNVDGGRSTLFTK